VKAELPAGFSADQSAPEWGSDVVAAMLRKLDVRYIALNPGSSYRGLHDSLVNFNGNVDPQMLVCLHEEAAVAIAHGYAKVTGRPMAVAVHSNVGLMHASMAVYNAYCDRVPMLILGAAGPFDANRRRPWIDWIHTSADQGALIRPFSKWDDQPASVEAAVESLARAHSITSRAPSAPVYVCLDVSLQEQDVPVAPTLPDPARDRAPRAHGADATSVRDVVAALEQARRPLLLIGRVSRDQGDWQRRIDLAERYGALVVTDLKVGAAFPTRHRLHPGAPANFLPEESAELIGQADLILSLDWVDVNGTLKSAETAGHPTSARVISCTLDEVLHNGWSKDHFSMPQVDLTVTSDPDQLVSAVLDAADGPARESDWPAFAEREITYHDDGGSEIFMRDFAGGIAEALRGQDKTLVRVPLGWRGADLDVNHPLDFLGMDGAAGIGSGPGMAVGAALALEGTGRIPVALLGDGDLLMGGSAIWTAAHYEVPMLIVVANNAFYYNDVVHQDRIAVKRERPRENVWIGQAIAEPEPDLAGFARSLGVHGIGQVRDRADLAPALAEAVKAVQAGQTVLVDVRVRPDGYKITTD
jgi:thiamine pyrophosphate-dependent acetolactate synthase large subunit-like protein